MAIFLKIQTNLKQVQISTDTKKKVAKKLKKACKMIWLSFDSAVSSMKSEYVGVMSTLRELDQEHNDPTASGLIKKMHNVKFIGAIFILSEILPILSQLSIVFQRSCINFSQIEPRVEKTMDDLRRVETEKTPIRALKESEATYAATGRNLNFADFRYREMENYSALT